MPQRLLDYLELVFPEEIFHAIRQEPNHCSLQIRDVRWPTHELLACNGSVDRCCHIRTS
jgi:hypothetical protein